MDKETVVLALQDTTYVDYTPLFCYIHKIQTSPKKPPTLKEAARWIAKLGGFLGRIRDGHPDITVMWRGLQRLSDLVSFWLILIKEGVVGDRLI